MLIPIGHVGSIPLSMSYSRLVFAHIRMFCIWITYETSYRCQQCLQA